MSAKEAMAQVRDMISKHGRTMASELVQWDKTGLLSGPKVREAAGILREHFSYDHLSIVRGMVQSHALEVYASAPTPPASSAGEVEGLRELAEWVIRREAAEKAMAEHDQHPVMGADAARNG